MSALSFEQFVRETGLLPRKAIAPDGRWHRCPTEDHPRSGNGAYKLAADGLVGWVQNHAVHTEPLTWRPDDADEIHPVDRAALARRLRQRDAERAREQAEAAAEALKFYRESSPLFGGHPYLERKGLTMRGCRGLRVDADGWLVVPMGARGRLMSLQRISPDGDKKFWYGASVKGAHYLLERPRSTVTVLVEGLATGLAVYAAVPDASVVVTFTAANLVTVAGEMRASGLVVVAADNDHRTVCPMHRGERETPFSPPEDRPEGCRCNPGRIAGLDAARSLGCGYAYPEGIEGTDWDDYRAERLAEGLRPMYGRREVRESDVRRRVEAEIRSAVMRRAAFVAAGAVG